MTTRTAPPTPRPARVFVARVAGLAVFDPSGDQVGRVRDVVVTLRLRMPPRVVGLVVEVQRRRRIFVSIGRVTSFDAGQVRLNTGVVNLRQFTKRVGETLVVGELLDRTVHINATGAAVTVLDCAIEPVRGGEWHLTRVAVRIGGGGAMRRRGEVRQQEWDEVTGFAVGEEETQGAEGLLAIFEGLRPADMASVMHDLSQKRRGEVAAALDDERLADVLEELPEDEQIEILATLSHGRAADVLEEMSPDDAADVLAEMQPEAAERLLELMEPDEAADVRRLLAYGEDTAGGLMTSEPVVLTANATVAEALARIRMANLTPALASQVFVVRPPTDTPTGRLLGIAHIQRLLREVPSQLIGGVADTDLEPLGPHATLAEVAEHLATYNLLAVPICDEDQRLLGAVTVDDVLDHLLPENWRDEPSDGA